MRASRKSLISINDPFSLVNIHENGAKVDLSILKTEALMFDTVCIPTLKPSFFGSNCLNNNQHHVLDELEWLLEYRIIQEVPHWPEGDQNIPMDAENFAAAMIRSKLDKDQQQLEILKPIERTAKAMGEIAARMHVLMMQDEGFPDVYPVVDFGLRGKESEPKSEVVDIVIQNIPMPHEDTPWEHIYEIKGDPDTRRKFLALKDWISDTARLKLEPNEIEDKLKSLIAEYEAHMRLHRVKTRLQALKTVVMAEIGIAMAGVLTGHWAIAGLAGMIATPLYSLKMHELGLQEEERRAPGKELAYIVKLKKEFGQ